MNMETELVISSALDGERTDIETLRSALATEEGREMLASFVLLRAQVAADGLQSNNVLHGAECRAPQPLLSASSYQPWWHLNARFPGRLMAGASFATLALACAFWLGTAWYARQYSTNPAQNPTIVGQRVEFRGQMAESESPTRAYGSGSRQRQSQAEPPKPTRVLRFVPGTDWHSDF
jgi:hypothetical protein